MSCRELRAREDMMELIVQTPSVVKGKVGSRSLVAHIQLQPLIVYLFSGAPRLCSETS
jgi:hypothetical protein